MLLETSVYKRTIDLLQTNTKFRLGDFLNFDNSNKRYEKVPKTENKSGFVYAFWIDNSDVFLPKIQNLNRKIHIQSKIEKNNRNPTTKYKIEKLEFDWNLEEPYTLIYVGKTTSLRKRLGLHIKFKTESNYWKSEMAKKEMFLYKKTTSCQLRASLEYLLKNSNINVLEFLRDRVMISYIEEKCFKNRFYIEDLAIGLGQAWFNVDAER